MRQPHVDDQVRLTGDVPELQLNRGRLGVVRSTWFAPTVRYEVEFEPAGDERYNTLALLVEEQIAVAEVEEPVVA